MRCAFVPRANPRRRLKNLSSAFPLPRGGGRRAILTQREGRDEHVRSGRYHSLLRPKGTVGVRRRRFPIQEPLAKKTTTTTTTKTTRGGQQPTTGAPAPSSREKKSAGRFSLPRRESKTQAPLQDARLTSLQRAKRELSERLRERSSPLSALLAAAGNAVLFFHPLPPSRRPSHQNETFSVCNTLRAPPRARARAPLFFPPGRPFLNVGRASARA